jgi:hypothetical protein
MLQAELMGLRLKFIELTKPVSQRIADLVAAADSFMIPSADEISAGEVKIVRQVRTKLSGEIEIEHDGGGGLIHLTPSIPRAVLAPGKRACGLCRQPGHRQQNCPNAHVVREQKIRKQDAPKPKQKRKPLTPEQRAAKVEILKRARAARKGNRK